MLGLLDIFGRAESLKSLDLALREFDVHPRIVPEAVKLATVRLLKNASGADSERPDVAYTSAAELLSYCLLGPDQFVASNTLNAAKRAEHRLEKAIAAGNGLDVDLILLALHSGVIHTKIADRFDVETSE